MSKAKILGCYKSYIPNNRADARRWRPYRRNREKEDKCAALVLSKGEESLRKECKQPDG